MLSIGAFSKLSKVSPTTLRYYDEIGLIKPIQVNSDNSYRYYDVSQLETIILIHKLKSYEFSLEEIATIITSPESNNTLLSELTRKLPEIQNKLSHYHYLSTHLLEDIETLKRGVSIMAYLDQIEVKLVQSEAKNILSLRQKTNPQNFGIYLGKLQEIIVTQKLTPTGPPISIFHDEEPTTDDYDIEIGIPIKETTDQTRTLESSFCAQVILKGPYSELPSVYTKLKQWVDQENYQLAAPAFEIYITNPYETAPENYITEVYIPIKKSL